MNIVKALMVIRDRYFRPVMAFPDGHVNHFATCEIHSACNEWPHEAPFCSCGLLDDLKRLRGDLDNKVYGNVSEDTAKQWGRTIKKPTPEEEAETLEELHRIFGKPIPESDEEMNAREQREWDAVETVFGKAFADRRKSETQR